MKVCHQQGHRELRARRAFVAGETILTIRGRTVRIPNRYSIQIDSGRHVTPARVPEHLAFFDDYLWPFLNHSFQPSVRILNRAVVAIREISAGDEIHFDYNTTEWEMADAFNCVSTGRWVRGYRFLSENDRERIRDIACPYLLEEAPAS